MNIHADIPPFEAIIKAEFLYDMDPSYVGKTEECTVYAVSSYKGHYPTFKILLESGSLFDYIPIHALMMWDRGASLTLEELTYGKVCPDFNITVNVHPYLIEQFAKGCDCFVPTHGGWRIIKRYICTIDWFMDNHNAHLVALNNGQFALIPNHKLLFAIGFKNGFRFQPYKKLRQEWKP